MNVAPVMGAFSQVCRSSNISVGILKYFLFDFAGRKTFFIPLMLSAIAAGWLIVFASDKKTNWYFKFWTDGTMILQFLLLLLFNQ